MPRANYVTESQIIQGVARDPNCRWIWTKHGLEQMADPDRDATQADVECSLTNGQVVLIETHKKDILWRVVGKDVDGKRLTVVAAVDPDEPAIKVVSVWR